MKTVPLFIKKIIFLVTLILIIILIFLIKEIYNQKVLGVSSGYRLDKGNYQIQKTPDVKYFYQPKPNTAEHSESQYGDKGEITINSDGLNDRYDYDLIKPSDTFRIITLGDSFTYGVYLNTENNYPEKLEDLLNTSLKCQNIKKFEVINLAVPGYDLRYSLERFKIKGQKYDPDLVLWLITDDFAYIREDFEERYRGCLKDFGAKASEDDVPAKASFDCGEKSMKEIKGSRKTNAVFDYQIQALYDIKNYFSKTLVLTSFTGQQSTEVIEALKKYRQTSPNTYLFSLHPIGGSLTLKDAHPSVKGHLAIAQDIYQNLTNNNLLSCHQLGGSRN